MTVQTTDELTIEPSLTEVWGAACELLKKKLTTPVYAMWIQPLQLQKLEGTEATIATANEFGREWLVNNNRTPDIAEALMAVLGFPVTIKILVDPTVSATQPYTASIATIAVLPSDKQQSGGAHVSVLENPQRSQAANLDPKRTVESFVVGSHNRFSYSAAMAVADRPGQTYNPLFIYGGSGLGKTHLMQAIGHEVMTNHPNKLVRYITCERFTNDLINSIRSNSMIEFRKRYRQVDVLLVDDIHFIEGKESTQEEFFHTFNALRDAHKQIVLSSDRPPKEIPKLEDRLRSRFEGGLIADVQPPDLETRVAILRKKCLFERMNIPEEILEYVAKSFTSNVRELEGALLRVHAYASLTGMPLNIQSVSNVLHIGSPVINKSQINIETIVGTVAAHYRVDTSDLRSAKRSKDLATPRHIAMYLAHEMLAMSYQRIGEAFGNRKHPSVIYAINKVKEELDSDPAVKHAVEQIRRQLSN